MKTPRPAALPFLLLGLFPVVRADAPARVGVPAVHVPFIEGRPFAEVLKKAKAEKKPIILDVVAAWCGPCKVMDRTTFADAGVVEWAKQTLPVRVDAEKGEGRKLQAKYAVSAFPTVLFLDMNGTELDRMTGAHGPEEFRRGGESILKGESPLLAGLARVKKTWSPSEASGLAAVLAQRQDVVRLRPLVLRLVEEDPELTRPDILQDFMLLAILEDYQNQKISPEVTDLLATFLPRMGNEPRRGLLAVLLVRELGRRGEIAGARAAATQTVKALGESNQFMSELYAALGTAEKQTGHVDAAVAAFRKATSLAEKGAAPPSLRAERQLELADALAAAGKTKEAKTALASALEQQEPDVKGAARASRIALALKSPADALTHARRAVELSRGEDAAAQAALAGALAASGDSAGASAAWRRALEIEPDNAEYRRAAGKKPAT
jgi:tetratricopeptide (TPR) repeat protein